MKTNKITLIVAAAIASLTLGFAGCNKGTRSNSDRYSSSSTDTTGATTSSYSTTGATSATGSTSAATGATSTTGSTDMNSSATGATSSTTASTK